MRRRSRAVVALGGLAAAVFAAVWALRSCGDGGGGGSADEAPGVRGGATDAAGEARALSVVGTATPSPRVRAARPAASSGAEAAPEPASPGPPRRDLAVTFRVLRSEDRSPIEGGRVLVRDEDGHREFATDVRGEARFDIVPGDVDYGVLARDRARLQGSIALLPHERGVREFVLEPGAQAVGRITDETTGRGIADAAVEVRAGGFDGWNSFVHAGWEVGRATTDPEGRFRIDGLARGGTFTLRASATGYATDSRPLTPEDFGPCEADLALQPACTVRIRVLDEEGAPIPEARVFVGLAMDSWRAESDDMRELRMDAEGRCRVDGLRPDAVYDVTADRFDRQAPIRPGPDSVRRRVFPGTGGPEVVLRFAASSFLRVRALDADGAPWPGAKARIERTGPAAGDATSDELFADTSFVRPADGSSAVRLQPGAYRISLHVSDLVTPEPTEVELAAGEDRVAEIRLPPGSMEGRLVDAAGHAVEDGIVFLHGVAPPGGYACASTGADGRFSAAGLVPGRWQMYASGPEFDALLTEVDVPSPPREWRTVPASAALLRFPGDAVGRRVRVLVDRKAASRSADGSVWHDAAIDVAGDIGPDATFSVQVPPCMPLRFRIRTGGFLPVAVEAPAPAGQDFDVVVPALVPGLRIAGRVVDASGAPVAADVRVLLPEEERGGPNDDDGRFRTAAVPPGPVVLLVTPDAHRAERTVCVEAREGMDPVEIVVTKGGVLDVLCTDARGVPLPGREVVASGEGDGPLAQSRPTDARGRVRFRVHPGRWRVSTNGAEPLAADVTEGETSEVRAIVR